MKIMIKNAFRVADHVEKTLGLICTKHNLDLVEATRLTKVRWSGEPINPLKATGEIQETLVALGFEFPKTWTVMNGIHSITGPGKGPLIGGSGQARIYIDGLTVGVSLEYNLGMTFA